jgi:hypothetical protein
MTMSIRQLCSQLTTQRLMLWVAIAAIVGACSGDEGQQASNCSDIDVPTYTRSPDGGLAGAASQQAANAANSTAAAGRWCVTAPRGNP